MRGFILLALFAAISYAYDDALTQWQLQTSAKLNSNGALISKNNFQATNWYEITVPATVMAALIQNNTYNDTLFLSDNLQRVDTKQFSVPWWYRTTFSLSAASKGQYVSVLFKGINYRANIWVNGVQVAQNSTVIGTFRYFDLDITQHVTFGAENVLAVEVFKPLDRALGPVANDTDLAITFVDWSPSPPDANMGLWQEVVLSVTGAVTVKYPQVATTLNGLNLAHTTVSVDLVNLNTAAGVSGVLVCSIFDGEVKQNVRLTAGQKITVTLSNTTYPLLNVKSPRLWWPWQMGAQDMYNLTFRFIIDGTNSSVSDEVSTRFGVRQVTSELTSKGGRVYKVNGQNILIRGGGWSPDLFQRADPEWQENHFKYTRDMNLNAIRLEGKFENDHFFDLADEYGILIMPGWCCCDAWQHWKYWQNEQYLIAQESLRSQLKRLRIHPSILVFLYSSDELPPVKVEKTYLAVFEEENWPNPTLSSASDAKSTITGPSGVKMSGPYSWVPPNYWLEDTSQVGGAFGFLTEGGPGEAPLTVESFEHVFNKSEYWPINPVWNYHCGATQGFFGTLERFTNPLYARYGNATGYKDYLYKSQVAAYEGHRAMFEGYGRNKYTSTGVIQWMLNNPWPAMIWHLYDYYFHAGGTYFASKKACEPLHIQYSYDDQTVWVINSLYTSTSSLNASAQIIDVDGKRLWAHSRNVADLGADAAVRSFALPKLSNLGKTYFLKLELRNEQGKLQSDNFYWLSTSVDALNWKKSTWYNTPCTSYADFTALQKLPPVTLSVESNFRVKNVRENTYMVGVSNPSSSIAFFVHLRLSINNVDVAPIFWEDNYFTLLPHETKQVNATISAHYSPDDIKVIAEVFNNRDSL